MQNGSNLSGSLSVDSWRGLGNSVYYLFHIYQNSLFGLGGLEGGEVGGGGGGGVKITFYEKKKIAM